MNFVITGASSGIGRALAKEFTRRGHPVLAVARREERLLALQREVKESGAAQLEPLPLDLTLPEAPEMVLDKAVRLFGRIHGLVNDAGMSPYVEFKDLSYDHMLETIALNVTALTGLCHLFLPHMLAHGEPAHIVNVSSVGGYAPLPRFTVYSGSKHYVRIFTNLLRGECRRTNVKVSGLYPGGTLSEFPHLAGQQVTDFARRTMLTPEQVARRAYPAIMKGRRVIIPGYMDRLAIFMGKLLPFPWSFAIMKSIYDHNVVPVTPAYPHTQGGRK